MNQVRSVLAYGCLWISLCCGLLACDASQPKRAGLATQLSSAEVAERIDEASRMEVDFAYEAALAEDDPFLQHILLAAAYARVDGENLANVTDVFAAEASARSAREARVIGAMWGRVDPLRGLELVLEWERPLVRENAMAALMTIAVDAGRADEVVAVMAELQEDVGARAMLVAHKAMVESLFAGELFDQGLAYVENVDADDETRSGLVGVATLATARREGGTQSLVAWVEQRLDSGEGDRQILKELSVYLLRLISTASIERGQYWFETHLAGKPGSDEGLAILSGSEWARQNPEEALAYIRNRPDSEPIKLGLRSLAYLWLKNDGKTALPILLPLVDEDPRMEPLLFPIVQYMIPKQLEPSLILAQRIPDPEEKHAALEQGLMRWARRDPEGVEEFIADHPISPALRRSVAAAKALAGAERKQRKNSAGSEAGE